MISTIDAPHIDETGTYPGSIGFIITCNSNLRKNYFEYHIPSLDIITSNSYSNIVDIAWSNLSSNINEWAATIITSNVLIGTNYIPEDDFSQETNINLATFNANYIVNITNLYVYPTNTPTCWLVNFNIKNIIKNEIMYINSQVPIDTFSTITTDMYVVNRAWNIIKNQVGNWAYSKLLESPLINTIYYPQII